MGSMRNALRSVLIVMMAALALGLVATPANAQSDDLAQARKHMDAGVRFMQDPAGPKWDEAYVEFKKAYALSDSTNALLNLAICAQKLELDGEAIEHYETLLSLGKELDWRDRKQIKNDLKVLNASVVRLTVKLPVAVKLTDVRTPRQGKPLRNVYELEAGDHTLGIHPGDHRFTASAEGKVDESWDAVLQNGSKLEHAFVMKDIPPPAPLPVMIKTVLVEKKGEPEESRPVPLYVLAPGLLTLAAGGVMGTFMVLSTLKADELEEARGIKTVAEQRELRDKLVTYNLVADIGIGVTAAAAATTLILILTRPTITTGGDAGADAPSSVEITEPEPGEDAPEQKPEAPTQPEAPTKPEAPKKQSMRFGVDWVLVPTADPYGGGAVFSTRF